MMDKNLDDRANWGVIPAEFLSGRRVNPEDDQRLVRMVNHIAQVSKAAMEEAKRMNICLYNNVPMMARAY